MKKKMIFAGVVVLLSAAAVTGYITNQRASASDLFSANVEALTRGESSSTCDTYCYPNDSYRCSVYIDGLLVARCTYMDKR